MALETQCRPSTADSWNLPASSENPFDWTYDELRGRATGIYLPMDRDEVLVNDGDVVDIQEQTLDGSHFIVHNKRTGQTGKVPVEYIDIIPEDVDHLPLSPATSPDSDSQNKPAHSLIRRQGVCRSKGEEIRTRMSAVLHSTSETDNSVTFPADAAPASQTFPRVTQRLAQRVSTTAQSGVEASLQVSREKEANGTKSRAQTILAEATSCPSGSTSATIRDTRTSSVPSSSATAIAPPADRSDDVTVYEPGFKRVEEYNIVSVSGSDRDGRPVILLSACRLPPSFLINHDVLLRYLKYTLDKYVEQDYTLVYFHHGFSSSNKPRFSWLRQVYKELDRKYKKNLKKLYIVHPTNFIRVMMVLCKPFISYKFGRKVSYINRLEEMKPLLYLERLDIPDEVKRYDITLAVPVRQVVKPDSRSVFHTPMPREGEELAPGEVASRHQFGVRLENLVEGDDTIPLVLRTCVQFIEQRGMDVVGIFRRAPATATVHAIKEEFDRGSDVDLNTYSDPHLAAVLIKLFLRELPEPLVTFNLYQHILEVNTLSAEEKAGRIKELVHMLPQLHFNVLKYLITFLSKIAEKHEVNKMTELNLAIVFGPNLVWSPNEALSLGALGKINNFTYLLICNSSFVFDSDV